MDIGYSVSMQAEEVVPETIMMQGVRYGVSKGGHPLWPPEAKK